MTKSELTIRMLNRQIDILTRKRDQAADVQNNTLLAWSYQQDIDKYAARIKELENEPVHS
jgi:hypothetical protein